MPIQSDFISMLLEYTKDYESPTSFWKWSGYSAISAALRFNVYLKHKIGKIYPNTYILLLADAAKYRKGIPLDVVNNLLAEINCTKTFTGTASVQGILDKLHQAIPIKKKGITLTGGACLILAEELASFFVDDPRLIPMLTRMYDYSKLFPYDLRSGTIVVKDLCVSILAASNETHLREVYTSRAIYGGLLRRTLLIKPDETRKPNSLINPDHPIDELKASKEWTELVAKLTEISLIKGEVTCSREAGLFFTSWYEDLYNNYDKYGGKTGVIEGIHTLVLKIALILAVSSGRMTVEIADLEQAILEVTALRSNYELYAMSTGRSEKAESSAFIFSLFWNNPPSYTLKKKDILFKYWNEVTNDELEKILETFIAAGLLTQTFLSNELSYTLTQKAIDAFAAKLTPAPHTKASNP